MTRVLGDTLTFLAPLRGGRTRILRAAEWPALAVARTVTLPGFDGPIQVSAKRPFFAVRPDATAFQRPPERRWTVTRAPGARPADPVKVTSEIARTFFGAFSVTFAS